jgi:hypothetical protein
VLERLRLPAASPDGERKRVTRDPLRSIARGGFFLESSEHNVATLRLFCGLVIGRICRRD